MKKLDILMYTLNLAGAVLGFFIGGFLGGIATGACLLIIFLSLVGKLIFRKAARRIDKLSKDAMLSNDIRTQTE